MCTADLNVLHVIGADTLPTRLETLRTLHAEPQLGRQRIVHLGPGSGARAGLGEAEHLATPFGVPCLARRALSKTLPSTGPAIVHLWSPGAAKYVAAASRASGDDRERVNRRLLVDVEVPLDFARLRADLAPVWASRDLQFVCPSETARRRLLGQGLSPERCVLIRDSADLVSVEAADRAGVRSELDLSDDHAAVLVLPPVLRETGAFVAAWATMLLEKMRPGVRLIVPDEGREVRRVKRLIQSCRHEWIVRFPGCRFGLPELSAATDLAVYLPTGAAPLSSVIWALAAGKPTVASAVPATRELLTHGQNAWLCKADDPKDAARRLLEALENPQESRRQVEAAQAQFSELFDRGRMVADHRRTYENVLAGRDVADGIDSAPLLR